MYKKIITFIIALAIVVPAVSSALTRDEILAEIARLIKIVDTLKAQMRAIGIDPDAPAITGVQPQTLCLPISRALTNGFSGSDVYALQGFLIEQGVLSDEYSTGFYGAITKEAVARWQLLSRIPATGVVDKQTVDAMKAACVSGVSVIQARTNPISTTTVPRTTTTGGSVVPVDNFSFTIEPTTGKAPHAVSAFFAVAGTTCTSYSLDWGDGTAPVTREGGVTGCDSDQINRQLTHVYQARGSYVVVFKTIRGYLAQAPAVTQKTITVQ